MCKNGCHRRKAWVQVPGRGTEQPSRYTFASLISALLLVGIGGPVSCAHTTPSLWTDDPVPTYTRPTAPEIDDAPSTDVELPTKVAPGQLAPGGGLIFPSDDAVMVTWLARQALPSCEVAAESMSSTIAADRQRCDAQRAIDAQLIEQQRVEIIAHRLGFVAAVVGVAAAFVAGFQAGVAVP